MNTAQTTLSSVSVGLVVDLQKTICDRLEKCDEALLIQLSLYPLCLTVYKLIGFGVEVLV